MNDFRTDEVSGLREQLAQVSAVLDNVSKEHAEVNEHYIEEGQKRRAAEARVAVLETAIKTVISNCDECGGQGFNVTDDGNGDIDKDPCNSCWDLRELIQDHTDYTLKALQETTAALEAAAGPGSVQCSRSILCSKDNGHGGECDDDGIPF